MKARVLFAWLVAFAVVACSDPSKLNAQQGDQVHAFGGGGPGFTERADVLARLNCSPGERPEWDGSAWQCRTPNDYRSTHFEWNEEFLQNANMEAFICANSGTSAACNVLSSGGGGTGARPGILGLESGTATLGTSGRRTAGVLYPGSWTKTTYDSTWAPVTLSAGTDEYLVVDGTFASAANATQPAGCFFAYDRGNVLTGGINASNTHNLEAVAAQSSTRTRVILDGTSQDGAGGAGSITTCTATVGAVTLPNTGFHTYRVVQNDTSSCQFYVDGSLCTTLTTNIPAAATVLLAGTFVLKSAGTTNRIVYMDRHRLAVDMPAARSP